MIHVDNGQCGLCEHFGEHVNGDQQVQEKLVQIRVKHEAPEDFKTECGHPQHEALHLVVTADSGCNGFTPATH